MKCLKGIRVCSPKKVTWTTAQLKCLFASTCNKQEELEATVQLENYDLIGVTETWLDKAHDWSAAVSGYKLFRRDRQGRGGAEGDLSLKTVMNTLRAYG